MFETISEDLSPDQNIKEVTLLSFDGTDGNSLRRLLAISDSCVVDQKVEIIFKTTADVFCDINCQDEEPLVASFVDNFSRQLEVIAPGCFSSTE